MSRKKVTVPIGGRSFIQDKDGVSGKTL